jgi:hypothetical protein
MGAGFGCGPVNTSPKTEDYEQQNRPMKMEVDAIGGSENHIGILRVEGASSPGAPDGSGLDMVDRVRVCKHAVIHDV